MCKKKRKYNFRVSVKSPMPIQCPRCGSHRILNDGGTRVNKTRDTIAYYKTCVRCGCKITATRPLTPDEQARGDV